MIVGVVKDLFPASYKVNEKFITFSEFAQWGDAYNKCIATNKSLMIVDDSPVFIWSEPVITVTDCIVTFVVLPIVAITSYVLLIDVYKRQPDSSYALPVTAAPTLACVTFFKPSAISSATSLE